MKKSLNTKVRFKKALFTLKDTAKGQNSLATQAGDELQKARDAYAALEAEFKELRQSSDEKIKLTTKRYEKTKSILQKVKGDLKLAQENVKDQAKTIAGFTKI